MTEPLASEMDRSWLTILGHPLRIEIVRHLLGARDANPAELARLFEQRLGSVSYHFRVLRKVGHIRLVGTVHRRGAVEHRYALTNRDATIRMLKIFGNYPGEADASRDLNPFEVVQLAVRELRSRRESQGIERGDFAVRLRVSRRHLVSVENGDIDPRSTLLSAMAGELNTSLSAIFAVAEQRAR